MRDKMKVKDVINLKGCYSAHDVGEKDLPLLSVDEITYEINMFLEMNTHRVFDLLCQSDLAEAIHAAQVRKAKGE